MLQFYMVLVLKLAPDVSVVTPTVLAIVPILLYLASSTVSLTLTRLSLLIGRKLVYLIGALVFAGCCVAMMLIDEKLKDLIFVIAPFLGIAQSMTFNMGMNYIVRCPSEIKLNLFLNQTGRGHWRKNIQGLFCIRRIRAS